MDEVTQRQRTEKKALEAKITKLKKSIRGGAASKEKAFDRF
jgi:hypothetical protein